MPRSPPSCFFSKLSPDFLACIEILLYFCSQKVTTTNDNEYEENTIFYSIDYLYKEMQGKASVADEVYLGR